MITSWLVLVLNLFRPSGDDSRRLSLKAQAYKSFGQIVVYFLKTCIKNYFKKLGFLPQGIEKEDS